MKPFTQPRVDPITYSQLNIYKIIMTNPSSPKRITWIIGLACGIAGIIGHLIAVPYLTLYSFTLVMIGFIVLAVGTTFRGF